MVNRGINRYMLTVSFILVISLVCSFLGLAYSSSSTKKDKREKDLKEMQKRFEWWPTDARPSPVKDEKKGGYWWWPVVPGDITPWGNRGYIYVYKIIFDYMEDELPPPKPQELRPSLLIRRVDRNIKIYFDYDSAVLRKDAIAILEDAVRILRRRPETDILITGNCDIRGSEEYNLMLGKERALAVKKFILQNNIPESRIRIISRGKLDAVAPVADIVGMQRDRNAHFMIAEVEEIMIPYHAEIEKLQAEYLGDGRYLIEKEEEIESKIKVEIIEYKIKSQDSLWKIAQEKLGSGHRWKYLYELNRDKISDPNKLVAGTVISIPIENEDQAMNIRESVLPEMKDRQVSSASDKRYISYVVQKDDSLWKIAKNYLGDGNRWREIYELNRDVIKNPDKLPQKQVILIPGE